KKVGPDVSCATRFRAMHDDNVIGREARSLVCASDQRIVPLGHLAKVNARQGLRCKVQRCGDSGKVVGGNDGTEHGREMKDGAAVFVLESFGLIVIHGAIGGAEIDGTLGDLLNAAARTDRLIVDLDRKSTRLNSSHVSISYAVF